MIATDPVDLKRYDLILINTSGGKDSALTAWYVAQLAEGLGVKFRFGVSIQRILSEGRRITGIATDAGDLTADAYVVALGSYSPLLLWPLGLHLPVYPVKGYSITVPITDPTGAPESTVMDETFKVAVTRLGDRIRVGGTAELVGYNLKLRQARRDTLDHVVTDLFPRGGDLAKAEFWTGLRPMTPDNLPIVGRLDERTLIAAGHGRSGFLLAPWTAEAILGELTGAPLPDAGLVGAR